VESMRAVVAERLVAVGNVGESMAILHGAGAELEIETVVHSAAGAAKTAALTGGGGGVIRALRVNVAERAAVGPASGLADRIERLSVAGSQEMRVGVVRAAVRVEITEINNWRVGAERIRVGAN